VADPKKTYYRAARVPVYLLQECHKKIADIDAVDAFAKAKVGGGDYESNTQLKPEACLPEPILLIPI